MNGTVIGNPRKLTKMYDAWVIYTLFSLRLAWVWGPGAVVVSLDGKTLKPSWFLMTFCLLAIPLDGDLLRPYNPVPKFIIIKPVVFPTYWQGVLVFLAAKSRFIKNTEKAADLQSYVSCVEMLIAAIGKLFVFPYKEYAGQQVQILACLLVSGKDLSDALKFNDFYHDIVHRFAPTYNEYVLYNHKEGDDTRAKYPSQRSVPIDGM